MWFTIATEIVCMVSQIIRPLVDSTKIQTEIAKGMWMIQDAWTPPKPSSKQVIAASTNPKKTCVVPPKPRGTARRRATNKIKLATSKSNADFSNCGNIATTKKMITVPMAISINLVSSCCLECSESFKVFSTGNRVTGFESFAPWKQGFRGRQHLPPRSDGRKFRMKYE